MARNVTGSNIGLSFIDVLASALGAAVLLFVILAATPPQTVSRAKAVGTFIRYEWDVAQPAARLGVKIYMPGSDDHPLWIDPDDMAGTPVIRCFAGITSIVAIGFSPNSAHQKDEAGSRKFVLRLNGLSAGTWRVGVVYYDWVGEDRLLHPPSIDVTALKPETDSEARLDDSLPPSAPYGTSEKLLFSHEAISQGIRESGEPVDRHACPSTKQ